MINYRGLAQEWLHNVLSTEAEEFSQKYQHIEEGMKLDHGEQFSMDNFISALEQVEEELYEVLHRK